MPFAATMPRKPDQDESLAFDLIRLLTSASQPAELSAVRSDLAKLPASAKQPINRQLGLVALVAADGGTDKAWSPSSKSVKGLKDIVAAVPMIGDPGHRAGLYPKVAALLTGLPKELGVKARRSRCRPISSASSCAAKKRNADAGGGGGLQRRRERRSARARRQKNTAHGGVASRAIDGNTSGSYGSGSQTHTQEGTPNPWWEVDLGGEYPIESIVIYNRTDGGLGKRLKGFTLKVLDSDKTTSLREEPAIPHRV